MVGGGGVRRQNHVEHPGLKEQSLRQKTFRTKLKANEILLKKSLVNLKAQK